MIDPLWLPALFLTTAGGPASAESTSPPAEPAPLVREDGDDGSSDQTTVVARKWEESLEDVPASVSIVSGDELRAHGWDTLRDASLAVPNFTLTEFSSRRLSFPFVRGIGSGQGDPAVITYVDGVPQFGSGGLNLPLVGVERVEFLRGPQGTLYGRNALGGVMHVVTRRPTADFRSEASVTLGEFDTREFGASASGPLGEGGPLFGIDTLWSERDGYTKNDFTGNDVDDRQAFFGRGQLLFQGADDDVRVSIFGESSRDGGFVLSDLDGLRDRPHRIDQDFEGVAERDVVQPSVTWEHYGDGVDFTSISAFQYWDVLETSDFDFSSFDAVRRRTEEEQSYYYQELRLASAADEPVRLAEDRSLRWLVGVSGFVSDAERSAANEFRPGAFPPAMVGTAEDSGEFDDFGFGLFGQLTLALGALELTGGLRYDYESKQADLRNRFEQGGVNVVDVRSDFDDDFDEVLPHASVAYRFCEEVLCYALVSRGFKAGGFNVSAPAGQTEFGAETSWTYELGARTRFFEDRLGANVAVFYVDWNDMQLSQFDATTGGYVDNAGESHSTGVELELDAEVVSGLTVFTSAGYTDTEFEEFVDSFGADAEGNDLPFAPEATWSGGILWRDALSDGLSYHLGADFDHVGKFFYDAGNRESESYEIVNFRAGLQWGHWGLDLTARNAFDEEYFPVAFQPNPADPNQFVAETGAPQVFLATLRFTN